MRLRTETLNKTLFAIMGIAFCVAAQAVERTYVGASDGAFGTAANWSGSTLPADGDTAIIPAGTRVRVSTTADANALKAVSYLKLDGADASVEVLNVTVDFNGSKPKLIGTGQFRARGDNSTKYLIALRQDNGNFAGSFFFSNITVNVWAPEAIGGQDGGTACSITHHRGALSLNLNYIGKGNYHNPVLLHPSGSWYGLNIPDSMTGSITNYGSLTIAADPNGSRINHAGNYDFVQRGDISSAVAFDGGDNAQTGILVFDCAVRFTAANKNLFMDSPGTLVLGPHFSLDNASYISANSGYNKSVPTIRFDAPDLIKDISGYLSIGKDLPNGATGIRNIVDINGFDQTLSSSLKLVGGATCTNVLTSISSPATFTLKGYFRDTSNTCTLDLGGHLTFDYSPANDVTTTIKNVGGRISETDGGLKVTRGTLKGVAGWRLPNVSFLQVGSAETGAAATLWLASSDVTINPNAYLKVEGDGALQIDDGVTLTVSVAQVGGSYLAADTYQADGSRSWLTGGGTLVVKYGLASGDFLWNGSAGASWTTPASWLVDGAPAARAPGAGDTVAVLGATDVTAGDADSAVLAAISRLKFLGAESSVTITNHATSLTLSANLEGTGTLRARDVGFVDNSKKPQATLALTGDNRAFTGSFWFTNTQVEVYNAYALGTNAPVTFWGYLNAADPYSSNHLPKFVLKAPGEYHNPLFLYGGGQGTISMECNGGITNWGHVTYWNTGTTVVRACGPGYINSYTGILAFGGGFSAVNPHTGERATKLSFDLNGSCAVIGSVPLDLGTEARVFSDNGTIEWGAPIETMSNLSAYPTIRFVAANVDVHAARTYAWVVKAGTALNHVFDMNGYDQAFGAMYVNNNARLEANQRHSITSAAPATLTLKAQNSSYVQAFTFHGAASLAMDSAGKTLTLSNVVGQASSTTGGIYAVSGTLALRDRASFANVSEIGAGKTGSTTAATLSVLTSDVQIGPGSVRSNRVVAKLDGVGKVNLPANYMLTVYQCLTNGVYLSPGSYTSSNLPSRVSGSGTLHVMRGEHKPHTMIIFR